MSQFNPIIRNSGEKVNTQNDNILESGNNGATQHSLSDIDKYGETSYNNYGWVLVDDVLSCGIAKSDTAKAYLENTNNLV